MFREMVGCDRRRFHGAADAVGVPGVAGECGYESIVVGRCVGDFGTLGPLFGGYGYQSEE